MSIIRVNHPPVKPTRRTGRPSAPFGAGLFCFVPFAVLAPGFVEPSDADRAVVGQMFADDAEPDFDRMAEESAYLASLESLEPPLADVCRSCGQPAELDDRYGRCDACDRAGTDASSACVNERFGLGRRVF
jgi:hypothetical protein